MIREEGLPSIDELMTRAERGDRRLAQRIIDALTTNETFFFVTRRRLIIFGM